MTTPVYVLGGHQTDFARRWEGEDALVEMLAESVAGALDDAGVSPAEVETAHVGNLAAELFCGQAHLGGMVSSLYPEWAALPTARHEAACASGSVAVLAAMAEIEAGRYDVAVVTGVERMRHVGAQQAAEHLGCAAWVGREATDARFPWPAMFSDIADEYDRRYGLDAVHLGRIAEVNLANAQRNPLAQTRDWRVDPAMFGDDDAINPPVEGRLRKNDCGRITDGAATVVVAGPEFARTWAARRGVDLDHAPRIQGWGHHTAPMLLADKLAASADAEHVFPHLRATAADAFNRAGISGPDDLDAVEVHDCFTITEYVAIDHLGLTAPGRSWEAIEEGVIDMGGKLPINPSGGLIGLGHPVGATGIRMLNDAARQVAGRAGEIQVEDAQRVATLNIGGSLTTAVAFVVGTG